MLRLGFYIRCFGILVALCNLITETAYLTSHKFANIRIYAIYLVVVVLKASLVVIISIFFVAYRVKG